MPDYDILMDYNFMLSTQNLIHNELIFRLLLKITVN